MTLLGFRTFRLYFHYIYTCIYSRYDFFYLVELPGFIEFTTGFTPSIPTTNYIVEFPVSDIPQSQSFTLSPVDDSVVRETIEVIQLMFAPIPDVRVTTGQPATVVIINDDG